MLASIDRSNLLMIHSLTNGIALNKIQLSNNLLSVHSMDLSNGGYVTLQGYIRDDSIQESRTSDHRPFIQSIGINGDFVGRIIVGSFAVAELQGDTIQLINEQKAKSFYINCITGKLELWNDENDITDELRNVQMMRNG